MKEAWDIIDLHYGDKREVCAKLKAKIINISLKASTDDAKEVKLFDTIQYISAKIKAAEGASMLEVDEEYIALVSKHLPRETQIDWFKSKQSGWPRFYSFPQERASLAK